MGETERYATREFHVQHGKDEYLRAITPLLDLKVEIYKHSTLKITEQSVERIFTSEQQATLDKLDEVIEYMRVSILGA